MTSSNGNIFRVTGPLCGEFTGPGEFLAQRPVTRSFDVYFDLRLNKRLCKQSWGWWFETLLCPLWRHSNDGTFTGTLKIGLVDRGIPNAEGRRWQFHLHSDDVTLITIVINHDLGVSVKNDIIMQLCNCHQSGFWCHFKTGATLNAERPLDRLNQYTTSDGKCTGGECPHPIDVWTSPRYSLKEYSSQVSKRFEKYFRVIKLGHTGGQANGSRQRQYPCGHIVVLCIQHVSGVTSRKGNTDNWR